MTSPSVRLRLAVAAATALAGALYLADLTGMGLVSADEPRYAAIGREMARSGDWVTPRLWGAPWFEKPALLYWMTAAGFKLGLGLELAPRLPVALLSLAFLAFFWWRLRIGWGARAASFATAMLATSAGWLAYSHVAVTDLPLAAFFSAAVLLSLPWIERGDRSLLPVAAGCLGIAAMAKGLVPLALFLPVPVLGWRNVRDWFRPASVTIFAVIALPWYILCYARNGDEFPRVLFVQQTFGRLHSAALQHAQPFWFYLPVLLLLLFPWFPMLAIRPGALRSILQDSRVRLLAAVALFGVVFFSIFLNKLPGYLLPLLPEIFAVMGIGLARLERPGYLLAVPVALLGAFPPLAGLAPNALAHGTRAANIPWLEVLAWLAAGAALGAVLVKVAQKHAFAVTAAAAGAGFLWFQLVVFPAFDTAASSRTLWQEGHVTCAPQANRNILYGLYYYSDRPLPPCTVDPGGTRVVR